jgi:heat shock protein HslJ
LRGDFSWDANHVKLVGANQTNQVVIFKEEENQVRQLDLEGNVFTGELAQFYVLRKNGNQNIEDKKWQLVELNGKQIKGSPETHYIIFHSKEGKLEAKANCNVLLNTYKIKNDLQVKIEAGISTLMACPDNLEQEFSAILLLADNLSTDGEILTLNKGRMAPLAKFELVEKEQ